MRRVLENYTFYKNLNRSFKVHNRLGVLDLDDQQTSARHVEFFIDDIINEGMQRMQGATSLQQLIMFVIAPFYFGYVNNPVASRPVMGNDINNNEAMMEYSTVFLPVSPFTSPPVSNLVYPDYVLNLSYNRDEMGELTRLVGSRTGMIDKTQQEMPFLMAKTLAPYDAYSLVTGSQAAGLTSEEQTIGLMVDRIAFPFSSRVFGGTDGLTGFQLLVNAEFYRRKYSTRQCSVNGIFNPNPVVGFPVFVVDRVQPFIGFLQGLSHTISAQGQASTNYMISMARPLSEEISTVEKMTKGDGSEAGHI